MTITAQSKTTLGLAATMVSVGAASTLFVSRAIGDAKLEIAGVRGEITEIREEVESKIAISAISEQALRMAIENPGLRVPDPRDPSRVIVVDRARSVPSLPPMGSLDQAEPAGS